MRIYVQLMRLLGAATLVLSAAACDGPTTPTPSPAPAPTAPPPAPAPTPPAPPAPGVTVSGIVREFTDSGERRPVPNLRLKVWAGIDFVGAMPLADTITDAQGRYTIPDVSALTLFFRTAPESDYKFLCNAWPVIAHVPSITDLPVVHTSWSGNAPPFNMLIVGTSVSGVVSERIDGTLQPVADATVTLGGGIQDPPAVTNTRGFYMICSVSGTDQAVTISAVKSGYNPVARTIFGGWDTEVNLELTRQ